MDIKEQGESLARRASALQDMLVEHRNATQSHLDWVNKMIVGMGPMVVAGVAPGTNMKNPFATHLDPLNESAQRMVGAERVDPVKVSEQTR
jgi:hypothetical protein